MKQQQQQAKQNEAEPESNSTEAGTNGETTNSETKTNSDTEDNKATDTKFSIPSFDVRRIGEYLVTAKEAVVENVKLAYAEMTGEKRESFLKREFKQAASYKPPKAADDDEEEGEKEQYTGPSALVHVKDPKSAWESMKERLQDSPFIREMLKRSKKIGRVAADTDIGKKAQNIGRSVQDKIEDAREFWETSQNPLVYTMSGIVENLTGETEEGIAIAEIRKLDPNFVKVIKL